MDSDRILPDYMPCNTQPISLPPSNPICWTRMQSESGQDLQAIVARKEEERKATNGVFFWGVGNAPPKIIKSLANAGIRTEAIFSIMKGKARKHDAAPSSVAIWLRYIDLDGDTKPVPDHILVTSRAHSAKGLKNAHYALICASPEPLIVGDYGPFDHKAYTNYGSKMTSIGASQVTALVQAVRSPQPNAGYRVNLRATLTSSYWVKLVDPVTVNYPIDLHTIKNATERQIEWVQELKEIKRNGLMAERFRVYAPPIQYPLFTENR